MTKQRKATSTNTPKSSSTPPSSTNGDNKKTYTAQELDQALYHATDIAGRCLLPFLLLGQCGYDIFTNSSLNPNTDGIELGAERKYFTKEVISTLKTLGSGVDMNYGMKEFSHDAKGFYWFYHGIPIVIQVIHRKYAFFQNVDFAWFRAEEYKVANPFKAYWRSRYLIQ